jgi:hypothetical protein
MGYPSGDIKLSNNFELNASIPIDSRSIVATFTDLANINFKYVGIIVYVIDDEKHYKLGSDLITWSDLAGVPYTPYNGISTYNTTQLGLGGDLSVDTTIGLITNTLNLGTAIFTDSYVSFEYIDGVNGVTFIDPLGVSSTGLRIGEYIGAVYYPSLYVHDTTNILSLVEISDSAITISNKNIDTTLNISEIFNASEISGNVYQYNITDSVSGGYISNIHQITPTSFSYGLTVGDNDNTHQIIFDNTGVNISSSKYLQLGYGGGVLQMDDATQTLSYFVLSGDGFDYIDSVGLKYKTTDIQYNWTDGGVLDALYDNVLANKKYVDINNRSYANEFFISQYGVNETSRVYNDVNTTELVTNINYPIKTISYAITTANSINTTPHVRLNLNILDGLNVGDGNLIDISLTGGGYIDRVNVNIADNVTYASDVLDFNVDAINTKYSINGLGTGVNNRGVGVVLTDGYVEMNNLCNLNSFSIITGDAILNNCSFYYGSSIELKGGVTIFKNCYFEDVEYIWTTINGNVNIPTKVKFEKCTFKCTGRLDSAIDNTKYYYSCFSLLNDISNLSTNMIDIVFFNNVFINTSTNTPSVYIGLSHGTVHFYNNHFYNTGSTLCINNYLINTGTNTYWYLDGNISNVSTDANITNTLPSSGLFVDSNYRMF